MTLAELQRFFDSRKRLTEIQDRKEATFHYILADLIGRSVSRLYNSANRFPAIGDVYPGLFDSEEVAEKAQEKKDELSALRFKLFAQSFNSKREEVAKKDG